jgi:chromate reductase
LARRAATFVPRDLRAVPFDAVRPLPFYDADLDGDAAPRVVRDVRFRVASAAGLVLATPEYNGTVPGGLKNTIDWLTRPPRAHVLVGKPVLVIGASPNSKGAAGAVDWLRRTLGYLGAVVVGEPIAVAAVAERLGRSPVDPTIDDELRAGIDALTDEVRASALVGADERAS